MHKSTHDTGKSQPRRGGRDFAVSGKASGASGRETAKRDRGEVVKRHSAYRTGTRAKRSTPANVVSQDRA